MSDSLLLFMMLAPLAASFLGLILGRFHERLPRVFALAGHVAVGLLLAQAWQPDTQDGRWWSQFSAEWIPALGISFSLSLDGLSALMVAMTALLGAVAVLVSWREVTDRVAVFHAHLGVLSTGVLGVFLATDLFLFFICWEIMLIPMFFMISGWGHEGHAGPGRTHAALKFMVLGQASGLLMLVATVVLAREHLLQVGEWSFNYEALLGITLDPVTAGWLMLGFFVAFAVKLPAVPLHGWLADAHTHAPTAASIDITGLLLKTSAYGLLRFCLPLFPEASREFASVAMWLGVFTVIYGGVLAYGQTHLKRLIAYTSISHMGFILVGIYAFNTTALQGVVVMMVAGGISTAALFVLAGQLYERTGTFDMTTLGGLWSRLPLLPPVMLFMAAATLGLPGLGNFIGEFLVLAGAFKVAPVPVMFAASGMVLAALYALALVHRTLFGPSRSDVPLAAPNVREFGVLCVFMAVLLVMGWYPQPLLDASFHPIDTLVRALAEAGPTATAQLPIQ